VADEDVDVLSLAGQRPPASGVWLWVTVADARRAVSSVHAAARMTYGRSPTPRPLAASPVSSRSAAAAASQGTTQLAARASCGLRRLAANSGAERHRNGHRAPGFPPGILQFP
jgi:hypothetical protein